MTGGSSDDSDSGFSRTAQLALAELERREAEAVTFVRESEKHRVAGLWLERWAQRTAESMERVVGPVEADMFRKNLPASVEDCLANHSVVQTIERFCLTPLRSCMDELRSHAADVFAREDAEIARRRSGSSNSAMAVVRMERRLSRMAVCHARAGVYVLKWLVVLSVFVVSVAIGPFVAARWNAGLEPWAALLSVPLTLLTYLGMIPFRHLLERRLWSFYDREVKREPDAQ